MSHSSLLEILVPASSSSSCVRHTYVIFKRYITHIPRRNKFDMLDTAIYLCIRLFIYSSFSDNISSLGYIVSDDRMVSE